MFWLFRKKSTLLVTRVQKLLNSVNVLVFFVLNCRQIDYEILPYFDDTDSQNRTI